MSAVHLTSLKTQHIQVEPQPQNSSITTAKMHKIALSVFAALSASASAAVIFFAASLALAPLVVATIAVAGFTTSAALIWQITRVKDYENPAELAQYRQEASLKRLRLTVDEHGWGNMFKYGIPTPEAFPERYRDSFHRGTTNYALDSYQEVQRAYQAHCDHGGVLRYNIPHPRELREKWNKEIAFAGQPMPGTQIVSTYNIEELAGYEILQPGSRQLQALRDCKRDDLAAHNDKLARIKTIDQTFEKQSAPHLQALDCVHKAVRLAREAQADRDWEAFKRRTEHMDDLNRNPNDPIAKARVSRDYWEKYFSKGGSDGAAILAEAQAVYEQSVQPFKQVADQQGGKYKLSTKSASIRSTKPSAATANDRDHLGEKCDVESEEAKGYAHHLADDGLELGKMLV